MYRFRDPHGRVIYVGKAKSLRSRLNSYFANPAGLLPKTYAMVHAASSVEWTVVGSELESLQLEFTWIKEFKPRFNVVFRDDKTYPYLALTMSEKFPRVQVMRGDRRKGTRYFGPYTAGAIRETMDTLLRVFPVRSCSPGVLKRAQASGRPCLLGYIDKCSAPCVGRVTPEEHRALAEDFCAFMGGEAKRFISKLEKQMGEAVAALDYERAARLRDDIAALRKVFERNAVVLAEDTDADVFALHGTAKGEILAIARILRANPEVAIDHTADSGEYCFKNGLGAMVHFATQPERTPEGVIYEFDASGLIASGLDPARMKHLPALGRMAPGVWYFLPKGQPDPHHGAAMAGPMIAIAATVK